MGEQPQESATSLGQLSSVDQPGLMGEQPQESATDRLAREFAAVVSLPEAPDSMCLSVLLDGKPIYEHRAGVALIPASLMKIVTAAAAVEVLGPAHTYTTEVHVRSDALESAEGGVLSGDIYLVGRGDPVLSTPGYVDRHSEPVVHTDVTELAERVSERLAAHGIGRVEGRVVGDSSWFDDDEHDYSRHAAPAGAGTVWRPSDLVANHSGPLSGLLVDDGFSSYPPSTVGGRRLNVRATDPARHAASVFEDSLVAKGIAVAGEPQSGTAPPQPAGTLLGSIESPRLSEIFARMLSLSDNTTAEMLFKEIGRRTSGSARAHAAAAVQDVIDEVLGPVAAGNVIVDGSGLSLHNRLTCPAVSALLGARGPRLAAGGGTVGGRRERQPVGLSCGRSPVGRGRVERGAGEDGRPRQFDGPRGPGRGRQRPDGHLRHDRQRTGHPPSRLLQPALEGPAERGRRVHLRARRAECLAVC